MTKAELAEVSIEKRRLAAQDAQEYLRQANTLMGSLGEALSGLSAMMMLATVDQAPPPALRAKGELAILGATVEEVRLALREIVNRLDATVQ